MPQPIVHFEIAAKDAKQLQGFYASLFGWKINANNPMQYGMVDAKQGAAFGIDGGIYAKAGARDAAGVRIYANVDNADAYMAKAVKLGAKVVAPARAIPEMGIKTGLFRDIEGNLIGVVETLAAAPARGR